MGMYLKSRSYTHTHGDKEIKYMKVVSDED